MSFIEQTAKIFQNTAELKFQLIMFGRDALYVEGAKTVKLDSDEMIFKAYSALITVTGNDLEVKELSGDCIAVIGHVENIAVKEL